MTGGASRDAATQRLPASDRYDAIVIGGGFYGATLAIALTKVMPRVLLLEKEDALLLRASFGNQARVHNGYHYPRSILTSIRSRVNYTRFRADYPSAIDSGFTKVYAVARRMSKVNAQQYLRFCRRIGAELTPAPREIARLFDPSTIEATFIANECAFDAHELREVIASKIAEASVTTMFHTAAVRVRQDTSSTLAVECMNIRGSVELRAGSVFNCTYSAANQLLDASGLSLIRLKHELAEVAIVDVPPEFRTLGITVMDGPFFSVMPFPALDAHSFTHVRYTPHTTWHDEPGCASRPEPIASIDRSDSRFTHMLKDAVRYAPRLAGCRYRESLWEVKTVLPESEQDDSRPILLHNSGKMPNFWTVLGAKIDGAYDVQEKLLEHIGVIPVPT
ncbi:MAG TPA: FAD-dependent oxidoreductase [Gemmatimonadaceae bacterium]|nr:FAD-dependent oxidoreductase [Gemmatimonadaceae bacterium]